MPELPEVETTLRGIAPHILKQQITQIIIRQPKLRWLIPKTIKQNEGETVLKIKRRGKYILISTSSDTLIIHLGMSGRMQIITNEKPAAKHDHFDIIFSNKKILRYTDPRRFGALLTSHANSTHALLKNLGVEPLTNDFNAYYLAQHLKNKSTNIKTVIMNSKIVVGVGNIYACEALHIARINPTMPAKKLSSLQINELVKAIKFILKKAIKAGGTTLKDFRDSEGKPGYFIQKLQVYGREGLPCYECETTLTLIRIANRSTVFCSSCQK